MCFVQCPLCGAVVELPVELFATDPSDPWSDAECLECDSSFAFDYEEVQFEQDVQNVL